MNYYGWRIAWALGITQTIGYGVMFYAFSVFIEPMEAELGWTRAETSLAFSLALLMSGLVAIPIGRFVDRRGARGLMTLGSSLGVMLVLLWSWSQNLWSFYLLQAAIGVVMGMTFYEVAFTVVAVWFKRDRASAMLIITMIAGFASTIFIPLSSFLVANYDWRDALRILALILALGTIPLHALILRKNPQSMGLWPDGQQADTVENVIAPKEALQGSIFWWLASAFALDRIVIIAIAAHSVPLLLERGFSPAVVAAAAGSIGLMQTLGRFVFTPAIKRYSLVGLTVGTFLCHGLALLVLLLLSGSLSLWLFAALFGMANGAHTLARPALTANIYGSAHYGSISGVMATIIALTQTISPLGAGILHDLSGDYDLVLWLLVGVAGLAAVAVSRVRPSG